MRYLILLMILLGLGSCASEPVVAGGSSDQGNAIEVAVVDPLQREVKAARIGVLPDSSRKGEQYNLGVQKLNSAGKISLKGYPDGWYVLVAAANELTSAARVQVIQGKAAVRLDLKSSIRLSGQVPAEYGDSIAILGLGKRIAVAKDGSFVIDSVPSGSWVLQSLAKSSVSKNTGFVDGGMEKVLDLATPDTTGVLRPIPPMLVPGAGYYDEPIRVYAWTTLTGAQMQWRLEGDSLWQPLKGSINVDSSMRIETRTVAANQVASGIELTTYQIKEVPLKLQRLESRIPPIATSLKAFLPDSVWKKSDTIWISAYDRLCPESIGNGFAAQQHEDSLFVYQEPCSKESTTPVHFLMYWPNPTGVWYVSTVHPSGYTVEIP